MRRHGRATAQPPTRSREARHRAARAGREGGPRADQRHRRHARDAAARRPRPASACCRRPTSPPRCRSRRCSAPTPCSPPTCRRCAPSPGRPRRPRTCARCWPARRSSPATRGRRTPACRTPTRCAARPRCTGAARDTLAHARPSPAASWPARSTTRWSPWTAASSPTATSTAPRSRYVLDFLAIAVADVGVDRRAAHRPDARRARSHGLPPFLAHEPGVDSGLMIAQYTQAGDRVRAQAARRRRRASTRSRPARCRRTTSRWAGRRPASCAVRRRARPGCSRSSCSPPPARSTCARPLRPGAGDRRRRWPALRARVAGPARTATSRPRSRPPSTSLVGVGVAGVAGRRDQRRRPRAACSWIAPDPQTTRRRTVRAAARHRAHRPAGRPRPPLRMLKNNLDPEVAEHPDDLVVYGGTGRAARGWDAFDAIVRTLTDAARRTRRCWCSRASRSGCCAPTSGRPRVLIANSNLVGDWANWEEFRRLEAARADDVRADDRGLVDLHRHPGHPAGHLRDVRRHRAPAVRRHAGRDAHPDRRARRDGRRAAARGDPERRRGARRRGRPGAARAAGRRRLPGRASPTIWTTRSRRAWPPSASGARCRVGLVGNAADVLPELLRRGVAGRHRHRPDERARPARATCRTGVALEDWHDCAAARPEEFTERARRAMAAHVAAMVGFMDARRRGVRLRQLDPRPRRGWAASSARSPSPGSCRRTSGRCSARAGARSAGWRCRATRPTSAPPTRRCSSCSPTTSRLRRWIARGRRSGSHFQGLPARICWLGYGERDGAGLRFNEMVASGEVARADRDRPRPPRLRLGRLARTARPRRWPTARTRSPTGRC